MARQPRAKRIETALEKELRLFKRRSARYISVTAKDWIFVVQSAATGNRHPSPESMLFSRKIHGVLELEVGWINYRGDAAGGERRIQPILKRFLERARKRLNRVKGDNAAKSVGG